jgi:alkanesulfonate monooxygenase SsuD/methylene tetrahydromethanopterin reductase-like flavin-dependent oxidoreductase (luciferase family)
MTVSAANFVAEPRDLFERRLPRHLRGHCPHVIRHPDGGEGWSWSGERPPARVFGWSSERNRTPRWTYDELPQAAVDPAAHLAAMDEAGIDAAVVFPLALVTGCRMLGPETARACLRAYNDWVGETVEAIAPARLLAPRLLPSFAVPWAVAREVDRALATGARALLVPDLPRERTPESDVIVAELTAADLTLCVTSAREDAIARVLAGHPTLRIVVAAADADGDIAGARLHDSEAPAGAEMWCANLPRRLRTLPADPAAAERTARRAFAFDRPPRPSASRAPSVLTAPRDPGPESSAPLPGVALAATNLVDRGPLTARTLARSAERVEAMGFRGIWVGDTLARRAGIPERDAFAMLGIAAAVTERVELGTCIYQVPLRNTVEVAHRALAFHQLVRGRFTFGVGAGSTPADFDAVGVPFEQRFARLRDALPVMRALWRGERVGDAVLHPEPDAIGGPPVLIGSWGGAWVERAARECDGWIASGTRTWRDLAGAVTRFKAAGGHRAVVSSVFADLAAPREPLAEDDRVHLACPPAEAVARLRRLGALGFTDVIVFNAGPPEPLAELAALLGTAV